MKILSEEDRQEVKEHVNDHLDQQPLKPRTQDDPEPPSKRRRVDSISEFDDAFDDDSITYDSELDSYLALKINTQSPSDILLWWKNNAQQFPGLAILAQNTLGVMATSAASERNFSLAGHVVSQRRTMLNPTSVNNILFMNSALLWSANNDITCT